MDKVARDLPNHGRVVVPPQQFSTMRTCPRRVAVRGETITDDVGPRVGVAFKEGPGLQPLEGGAQVAISGRDGVAKILSRRRPMGPTAGRARCAPHCHLGNPCSYKARRHERGSTASVAFLIRTVVLFVCEARRRPPVHLAIFPSIRRDVVLNLPGCSIPWYQMLNVERTSLSCNFKGNGPRSCHIRLNRDTRHVEAHFPGLTGSHATNDGAAESLSCRSSLAIAA